MSLSMILVVLTMTSASAFASPALFTFDVVAGNVVLNAAGQGSTASGLTGTFSPLIYMSNTHIGTSDTFILEDSSLHSTSTMKLGLMGLVTATLSPGSLRVLDFAPTGAQHISGNSAPSAVDADVYIEATVFLTGLVKTTFQTKIWAGTVLPFSFAVSTSASAGATIHAMLTGPCGITLPLPDIGQTITLDMVLQVQGTAFTPEPGLTGLTSLGIGAAGVWLRRRRVRRGPTLSADRMEHRSEYGGQSPIYVSMS